jgi:hypothetical protein
MNQRIHPIVGILPPEDFLDDITLEILKKKTPAERVLMAGKMWTSARVILRGAISTEHPDWTADQVNREIAKRMSGGLVNDDR